MQVRQSLGGIYDEGGNLVRVDKEYTLNEKYFIDMVVNRLA